MIGSVIQIFILVVVSSFVALVSTPLLTNFLYRHRLGKQIRDARETPVFSALHAKKAGTPTMGGILMWGTTLVLFIFFWALSQIIPTGLGHELNFVSRPETYLPMAVLVLAAVVGLADDFYNVRQLGAHGGGFRARHRLLLYTAIAALGAWWFFDKLDWTTIHVPFVGNFDIGIWYVPIFIFVIVATTFSVNEADGLDGLAGGLLLAAFVTYGVIAMLQGKVELASFIAVIVGALAAFLWFNIPPARFFMGDTGAMSMGVSLGVLALLTNTVFLLPIIGLPFVIESGSVLLQVASKKIRKKKIFLSSPIHHHLEAKGWSEPKIVMRFWIVASIMSIIGLVLYLADKT